MSETNTSRREFLARTLGIDDASAKIRLLGDRYPAHLQKLVGR